jgi:hypothetical protein
MYPAIKPGTTPNGPLPVLGHTPNVEGKYSIYVKPEMIIEKEKRQLEEDLQWLTLNSKKKN